ncbi:MAG: hypothetical protein IJ068_01005 [Bacilli bacterium]|nr:hypothetical protein [Bacilli bacterium]
MKNKILIICGFLVLTIFIVFNTFTWYTYFTNASNGFNVSNNSKYLETSGIIFQDNGNNVYDSKAESLEDDNIESVPSYNFKVTNTNNRAGIYNLYIEDLPVNMINDGCTEDTLLTRDQLKYQFIMNGVIIKDGVMNTINDNILDTREISANTTNDYSLKIYIHDEALNWFGKHYHYKVTINK